MKMRQEFIQDAKIVVGIITKWDLRLGSVDNMRDQLKPNSLLNYAESCSAGLFLEIMHWAVSTGWPGAVIHLLLCTPQKQTSTAHTSVAAKKRKRNGRGSGSRTAAKAATRRSRPKRARSL